MMECITSHLINKTRVIAAITHQLIIIIKDVFKEFALDGLRIIKALDGLRIIIFLNILISCFLNSHIFELFYYLKARRFILSVLLYL